MPAVEQLEALPGIYQRHLKGVRVLLRLDLNVPMRDGEIHNDARLLASMGAVQSLVNRGARTLIMSHLGRPDPANPSAALSLGPIAKWISQYLGQPVPLYRDWLESRPEVGEGQVGVLENVRFYLGELENNDELGQSMAGLCDLFVMDAFAVSHRANTSTEAVTRHAPEVCAGPLLLEEMAAVSKVMDNPSRPVVTIAGGAKISDKLPLLRNLANISDYIIPGGGIANTFLAARGYEVGQSLHQADLKAAALDIMERTQVLLPQWVVTAPSPESGAGVGFRALDEVDEASYILDVAPRAVLDWQSLLREAGTVLWNGPLGLFENPAFAQGTLALGRLVGECPGFTLAGGGDTLSAVALCGVGEQLSYLSTGGGAFLAALEGRPLPAVEALLGRLRDSEDRMDAGVDGAESEASQRGEGRDSSGSGLA